MFGLTLILSCLSSGRVLPRLALHPPVLILTEIKASSLSKNDLLFSSTISDFFTITTIKECFLLFRVLAYLGSLPSNSSYVGFLKLFILTNMTCLSTKSSYRSLFVRWTGLPLKKKCSYSLFEGYGLLCSIEITVRFSEEMIFRTKVCFNLIWKRPIFFLGNV